MKLIDYGISWYHPKLGDAIVHQAAFEHYKDVQWLHTEPYQGLPDVWKQTNKLWKGRYNLEIVRNIPKEYGKNFMMECAKEGIKITKPNIPPPTEYGTGGMRPYVTYQLDSSHPTGARDITLQQVKELADGLPMVNLDNIKRNKSSITRLLTLQSSASYHIGPDSGCAWSAISVGCPVRLILPDYNKLTIKEQGMHECAKALMSIQEGVEFI